MHELIKERVMQAEASYLLDNVYNFQTSFYKELNEKDKIIGEEIVRKEEEVCNASGANKLKKMRVKSYLSELRLNESQRDAIRNAISCRVSLVRGPPGTGKKNDLDIST